MKNIKISAYTTTRNVVDMGYPLFESVHSMMSFADEIVIFDNHSTDGTIDLLNTLSSEYEKIKVFKEEENLSIEDKRFAPKFDGEQKAKSRAKCTGDVLFQFDCDEVVNESESELIINCCHYALSCNKLDIFCLPIIEYWGSCGKVRCDIPFFKPRISINSPLITQGIPRESIILDFNRDKYSKFSDSCDYISKSDLSRLPYTFVFINRLFEQARASFFSRSMDKNTFLHMTEAFFCKSAGKKVPLIHHYSWFNIERKIRNYKEYWGKFWSSMFDSNADEQNFFFNKPWGEVSDDEIIAMAKKIQEKTSGWIFHKPIDFEQAFLFPYVLMEEMNINHPQIMRDWIKRNE